jgi:hypothetical protein
MSGESEDENVTDWMWAHILWQKRGLRMEEFSEMPRNVQLAYIASEKLAMEIPMNSNDRLAKVYIKTR